MKKGDPKIAPMVPQKTSRITCVAHRLAVHATAQVLRAQASTGSDATTCPVPRPVHDQHATVQKALAVAAQLASAAEVSLSFAARRQAVRLA
jgi:hypothetical protein